MTSLVLAWTKAKIPYRSLHLRRLVVGLKAQAHCLRLRGLILSIGRVVDDPG
jgi:hypothetical protein